MNCRHQKTKRHNGTRAIWIFAWNPRAEETIRKTSETEKANAWLSTLGFQLVAAACKLRTSFIYSFNTVTDSINGKCVFPHCFEMFSSVLHDFEMLFQWTTTINNFNKNRYISISWFDIRFLLYQRKNSRICVNGSRQLCSLSAGLLSVNQTIKRFSWRSWICHGRHFDTDSFF